jgi:F420-dependent oxidoreductase-like protein
VKLGLGIGYWGAAPDPDLADRIAYAESLGYESVWTAEAYGMDALTPLAWFGRTTSTMRLGTAICQMSARTPTATAMAAMTIDQLTGGRMVLGIGASGPQVVEGWYGQEYGKPLARTREYIAVMRQVMVRETVRFSGDYYQLPRTDGTGLGKALKSTLHPARPTIPILLAAQGPKNVALSAEIADGWIPAWFSPYASADAERALADGFAKREGGRPADFEVACLVGAYVDDDLEKAADLARPRLALYIGGMGAKGRNFHYDAVARLGFEAECAAVQEHYLAGRKAEAMAAIPVSLIEKIALVGPKEKIRDDLAAWRESPVTTLLVDGTPETLRAIADVWE